MAHKDLILGLDNRPFLRTLQETSQQIQRLQAQLNSGQGASRLPDTFGLANREAQGLNLSMGKMAGIIGATFGVATISQFAQKVAQTRGEFQQLEIAFQTMLGSKAEANKLMGQLVDSAAKTPFDLQGIASGAKQLLAYGVQADQVNSRLLKLGDIAAGLSIPLGDLVYLYGTTMTQGRMFTQDLRQFMGRGIPLAEELAKQFGVTKDKVGELVTAGKVGAKEFEKAIDSIALGKFNGLMEKQSKSITGQISNLEDSISVMFNNIGKSSEGIISGSIGAVATLVENYEKLGKVLAVLVATYGAYRTSLIIVQALQGGESLIKLIGLTKQATKAQALYNAVCNTNPYVRLVTVLVALGAALYAFIDTTDEATKAQERFNNATKEQEALVDKHRSKAGELVRLVRDETQTQYIRNRALKDLQALYPKYFANLTQEQLLKMDILEIDKELNKQRELESIALKQTQISELTAQLKEATKEWDDYHKKGNFGKVFSGFSPQANGELRRTLKHQLEKANKELEELKNPILPTKAKEVVATKDKSYYEAKKKKAQEAINALPIENIKKQTAEYKGLVKDLKEAEEGLALFEVKSKGGKAYDPTRDKEAIKRYTEEIIQAKEQSALELQQAQDLIGKEGYEREALLIEQNYQRQLADIKRYEKQVLEKQIEAKRSAYKVNHGGSDKGFKAEGITLSEEQTSIIDNKKALAEQTRQQSRIKLLEDYALQVQTYEEKVAEVKRKYADIIKAIEENKTLTEEAKASKRIEATRQETEAVKQVQEEALSKYNLLDLSKGGGSDLVEQSIKKVLPLFHDLSSLSFKELQKAKEAIKGIKIDPKTLNELEKAGVDIEALNKQLEELKDNSTGQVKSEIFKNLIKDVDDFGNALQSIGGQLSNLGGGMGQVGGTLSKLGGIASSGAGLASSIMTGDVLGAITNGIQTAIQVGELFQNSNEEEIKKTNERLIETNKNLDKRLGELDKTIGKGYGTSAIESAEKAIRLQKLKEANIQEQAGNLMGMHGKSHSNNYYWDKSSKGFGLRAVIGQRLGRQIRSIMEVQKEEWKKIIEEMPDLWSEIKSVGYYGEAYDKIEELAGQVGKVKEIEDSLVNAITGISFDGLRDDFVEQLMNMEASTEDFGKNISTIMQKSMLKAFVDRELNDKLKNWKDKLDQTLSRKDGNLTEDELSKLRSEYLAMVKDGQQRAKQLAQITGYEQGGADPRTASAKGIAQASQDSVNELNGLMHTSVMIQERIHKAVEGVGFDRFADIGQKVAQEVSLIRQINTSIKDTNERVEQNTKAIHNVLSDIKREGLNMKR